jgi:hypothetical protein
MLYSHFVRGQTDYEFFLGRFEEPRPSPAEALTVIRLNIDTNYPLPTSADRRHIILVVNELLAATDDLRGRADIVSGLGVIIDGNIDVRVAVTSLSKDKLQANVGPSMRAGIVIVLPPLTATSVNELISTLSLPTLRLGLRPPCLCLCLCLSLGLDYVPFLCLYLLHLPLRLAFASTSAFVFFLPHAVYVHVLSLSRTCRLRARAFAFFHMPPNGAAAPANHARWRAAASTTPCVSGRNTGSLRRALPVAAATPRPGA